MEYPRRAANPESLTHHSCTPLIATVPPRDSIQYVMPHVKPMRALVCVSSALHHLAACVRQTFSARCNSMRMRGSSVLLAFIVLMLDGATANVTPFAPPPSPPPPFPPPGAPPPPFAPPPGSRHGDPFQLNLRPLYDPSAGQHATVDVGSCHGAATTVVCATVLANERGGTAPSSSVAKPSTAIALLSDTRLLSGKEMMPRHMRGFWSRALRPAPVHHSRFVCCNPPSLVYVLCCSLWAAVVLFILSSPNDKAMRVWWRFALLLLFVGLAPMAAALQSAHDEAGDPGRGIDTAPPLVNASIASRVTRRLAVIDVQPGAGTLQAALNAASDGDELVLANGTYTGSGANVLEVGKSVTIRALHARGAILDGENARRVVSITSGTVVLEGLDITRGSVPSVRAPQDLNVATALHRIAC